MLMRQKVFSILALLLIGATVINAQSINAFGGQSQTISSDQTCTSFSVLDGSTLTVNQGVTLTLNISNGNNFNLFDHSTMQLHGTLAGSVASGATWMDNTYINVYLSDGAKYTVTGLTCTDGDNYLRYYGYDAATDGNGTVSVKNGTTDVTTSSIGYRTTTYTFTATPASGYRFVNWTKGAGGEVLGTDASINVTCEQNGQYQVYANFEQDAPAATLYDLTVGESAHGTVTFTVDGATATQAKKDDVVTVTVTPDAGYSTKDVTVRAYTTWDAAPARGMNRAPGLLDEIAVTKNEADGTWTFTMPEANVWVVATYTKNLQDAWIQTIADQTYTGEAITPTVTVKDGETTLVENTDYTVAYANNVETGTATVTVTGMGDYSGEATATFIIRADKSELNDAIAEAEAYYESIKDKNPEAAEALKEAIDAAKAVKDNADATQEDVNNALSALTTAKTTAEETVLTETKDELNEAITEAETYYESIKDKNPEAAEALKEAIDAAKAVKDDDNATQEDVENAIEAINNAKTTAENTVLTETKTELNNAITEAEEYYESIKESNPDAAEALKDAIDAAKAVKENGDATQTELDGAIEALSEAVTAAKTDVAKKRITLVIPAKSYVARVDADKRQIEVAVSGVSLYSVKSVTDSEVELTAELNVVAAEMPYLIYNDTDEEQTISIVVSTEDADAVEYDNEHFKGTLTDKTFTDEDMQAADHYVLQNNNFVWVKDAGTLAAGKCWIELVPTSEAHARRLAIVHEGGLTPTGINAVSSADNMDGNWYDLSGRRVAQPTKGLFIVNGKKVVVK